MRAYIKLYIVIGLISYNLPAIGYAQETPGIPVGDRIAIETILLEAQGESLDGQIAVGEVIRNRAKRGDLSHDRVCLARRQFSAWNDLGEAGRRLKQASGEAYQIACKAWYASEWTNKTLGATHYANLGLCSPSWARKLEKTVKIGNHTFYKKKAND